MRFKGSQDIAAGMMFVGIGALALYISADYNMGSARSPGTGVLPRILSWCLIGTGVLVWIKAFLTDGPSLGLAGWAWRPVIMVTVATVAFALHVDSLGLVPTMVLAMTIAALGTPETRWVEYTVFCLLMLVVGWGMFIYALGMPIPVWPEKMPDWVLAVRSVLKGGR